MGRINDRWYNTDKATGKKVPSSRHGVGKRWQAIYKDPNGKEHRPAFVKKVEAERELAKQEGDILRGSWVDPKAGQITVREFALKVWLPAQNINSRARTTYLSALENHLFPELGDRPLNSVRPSQALAWQAGLGEKGSVRRFREVDDAGNVRYVSRRLKAGYQSRIIRYVRGIFRLAVIDRVIAVSPFEQVRSPAEVAPDVNPPDIAQVRALISAATILRWAVMIEFCALTGLRSGELRGLTLDRVDFLRRRARIDRQLVYEPGRGLYFADLKTESGRRTLPLTARAVALLAAYLERNPVPASGGWKGLLFTMPGGQPIGETSFAWAMSSTCRRAATGGMWSAHDLRHHYATVLIQGGETPKVVQKRLGHKDVTTTLRIYSHFWADAEEKTRDVLDAAWDLPDEPTKRTKNGPGAS